MALSIELSFEDIEKDVGQHLNAGKSRDKWNAVKEAVMAGGQENIKKTIDDFEEHLTGLLSLGKLRYDLKTKHPIYWLARENLLKSDHQNSHDESDVSATKSNEHTGQMPSLSDLQKKIDNVMDKLQLEKRRPDARSTADDVDECVLKLDAIIEAVQGIPRRYKDLHFLLQESLKIKRLISPESTENQELPENAKIDEKLNLLKLTTAEIFETIDAKSYHYKKIDPKILENRRDERQKKDELKTSKPNKEVSNTGERQNTGMLRQEIAMLQDKERSLTVALQRMEADKNYWMNRVSQEAGAKMKDKNPGITDLSDANRPPKLAERYGEVYDNEWTEALEGLTKSSKTMKEESAIVMLCNILMITSNEQSDRISCRKALRDAQKAVSSSVESAVVNDIILEVQKKFSKERRTKQTDVFMKSSIKLCWGMVVQDPPLHFLYPACGREQKIDSDSFTFYTRFGESPEYIVWPAMLLHKDGPVLRKGVVQPYLVKK